jgi:hypothetical protein
MQGDYTNLGRLEAKDPTSYERCILTGLLKDIKL